MTTKCTVCTKRVATKCDECAERGLEKPSETIPKRALLVGINYKGMRGELRGCINDVNNMKKHLEKNGYSCTVLTDETETTPTKDNIVSALKELISSDSERMYFHYSGHGSYTRDKNGDEDDGYDETLVPLDYLKNGMITDDNLRYMLKSLRSTSKMTAVLDCCHSGSGMDLKYQLREKTRAKYVRKGRRYQLVRYKVPTMTNNRKYSDTPCNVVMLSGCQDSQTSADAYVEGSFQGAMTSCVLKALNDSNKYNWGDFVNQLRKLLKDGRYSQVCNLTSGRNLSLKSTVDFI